MKLHYFSTKNNGEEFELIDEDNVSPRAASLLKELQRESDRGIAIVGTALIEGIIEEILISFAQCGELMKSHLNRLNLASKADLAEALGLISKEERSALRIIQSVRNSFSHDLEASFSEKKIMGYCDSLDFAQYNGSRKPSHKGKFILNIFHLLIEMGERPELIKEAPLPKSVIRRSLRAYI